MEKFEKIHERALLAARRFREAEAELLSVLQEVDREKVYLRLGFSSLFKYAEIALKLSPATCCDFIAVARKSDQIPALKIAVAEGKLSVSKARRLTPVLTKENASDWIRTAERSSHRELEKVVAKAQPNPDTPDKVRFTSESILELKFSATEDTVKKFDRAKDLVSQNLRTAANYGMTLTVILEAFLTKVDRVNASASGTVPDSNLKRFVLVRDHRRCTFVAPNGRRCDATRWLDVHHIKPRSHGGTDAPENLTTLCSAHHRQLHSDLAL